ncbi:16S rRNA (uracil(1498)-N(3))-methyltransferase [Haloechinothrix sp. LS1_15]|uniref:16S rRNA (uracil(1498)-N(3))-methyltransferase n=1 Tax=Haloechinothrix sp. LS1_15 TaxID=2652248 RepID=UPI0029477A01|nr:16S rRNA (uracil(1498)-N(3))-methyltransferase [Haloechinothrix sp. LS1_15]MDV6012082.1 16S rRNA (uracil(1498)-N(3))-methyltransferase [Haloechinothrix sp. LS1_15]
MTGDEGGRALPVFLVEELEGAAEQGTPEELHLTGEEARHAATVLRMRHGERLVLTDGHGRAARGEVRRVVPGRAPELVVDVDDRWEEPPPALRVTVAQALVKGDRAELAVELATEAGADALVPWQAERCVARWQGSGRAAKGVARWRAAARAAGKQARRLRLPDIGEPRTTPEVAELARQADAALVLDARGATALQEATLPSRGELLLIVGPEGGITEPELDTLTGAGARPVRLGPSVLRASSAAAVALGALGALTDRWP